MTDLQKIFPKLNSTNYEITSPNDPFYNCIAWAAGDETRWWEPDGGKYNHWPNDVPREYSVAAFIAVFSQLGYVVCQNVKLERGFGKVAIFTKSEKPKHMARQLENGSWTSKCGKAEDISHELEGLEGEENGKVTVILKRPHQEN